MSLLQLASFGAQDRYLTVRAIFKAYFGWNDTVHPEVWKVVSQKIHSIITDQLKYLDKFPIETRTDPSILPLEIFDHILSYIPHHNHALSLVSKKMAQKVSELHPDKPCLDMFPTYRKKLNKPESKEWAKERLEIFNRAHQVKLYKRKMAKGFIYCINLFSDKKIQKQKLRQALLGVEHHLKKYG
uniref:F-box domain-containing protein n=1 Tax=Clandestinovirus TaxID=2831644 RepID=A0A8F8PK76_9VIRU|nr:hypothetical protein KOM_12_202 [Clandestinovirus]